MTRMDRARSLALGVARALSAAVLLASACSRPGQAPERGVPMPAPVSYRWLDLGPPIADDAFPGGSCGNLVAHPWASDGTTLLDGHLGLAPLSGTREQIPLLVKLGHRGMCSRSTLDFGGAGARMHIVAEELYRRSPRDFAAAIAALEPGTKGPRGRLDLPLPAVAVVPEPSAGAGAPGDFADVLRVYVVTPDDTVQRVSFSVSPPELAQGGSGCGALARDLARSLHAGPRALDLRAGPRDLRRFRVTLPGDFAVADPCADLRQIDVHPVRPLGAPSGTIHFVSEVSRFADETVGTTRFFHPPIPEAWFDDAPGGRLRRRAIWHLLPGGRQDLETDGVAVIIDADDADTLALLTRVAESAWDERLARLGVQR
jgi:hypothetical protein